MMDGSETPQSVGPAQSPRVLGLIINPIAGMGGRVALHGTDGSSWRRAQELGARPVAAARAGRALSRLARIDTGFTVLAAPGVMGADSTRIHGLPTETTSGSIGEVTTTDDTLDAATEMLERGVTLLLFAGGDGTARDIVSVVGERIPVLGIPSGVKMHSGVFGTSPEAAGDTAAGYLVRPDPSVLATVEVLDVEMERQRDDQIGPSFIAAARVPYVPNQVQRAKASPTVHDAGAIEALCQRIADEMVPERLYVIGPGTTMARVLSALDLEGTLTGVDVVRNRELVVADASESDLLLLLADRPPATIILGVIGGQGFLLGRGNQQMSPRVLASIDEEDVVIVASAEKILTLDPPVLRIDFGDSRALSTLMGYRRVRTGPTATTILKVVS